MRSYLWYDNTGKLTGCSRSVTVGFSGQDLDDSGSTDPLVIELRNLFITQDGNVDCLVYDCPCILGDETCQCSFDRLADSYESSGTLN
jgi:hypothetical protein